MREKLKYAACAFLTVMLLNMDMQPVTDELMKSWDYYVVPIIFGSSGYNLLSLLELILFYFFYRFSFKSYRRQMRTLRSRLFCVIPAVLFGFFMVLGNSFAQTDSWGLLIGCDNPVQLFKSLFAWLCYSILFAHLIALLFDFIDRYQAGTLASMPAQTVPTVEADGADDASDGGTNKKKKPKEYDVTAPFRRFGRWYMRMFAAHPFLTAFLTLLVVYLPVAIIYYPSLIQPDPLDEVSQVFGIKYYTAYYLQLVDENVVWTNHHPVFYTLYLWLGLKVGYALFHSYNVGLFLCTLGQVFAFAAAIAAAVRMLWEYRVPDKAAVLALLYFAVSPQMVASVIILTKDIFYACALLCVCMCLFRMLTGRGGGGVFARFLAAVFFATLLRNEGMYVLFCSFLLLFLFKKGLRKKFLVAAAFTLGVYVLWNAAILPAFHVTPTSVREVLSVPFQQTARYVKEYGDEVTEEEKEAINDVLEYDELADAYVPTQSDYVKFLYREDSDMQELMTYFRAWFQMLCKHPGVYIEATLNNIYRYFYPAESTHELYTNSVLWYVKYNMNTLPENGLYFTIGHPVTLQSAGLALDEILTTLNWLPGVELLQSSALYVWMFLLILLYACRKKRWLWIWSVVPTGVVICVCLVGPMDGMYFRYIFPVACILPLIASLLVFGEMRVNEEHSALDESLPDEPPAALENP